jgi:general secretion pathway protein L
MAISISRLRARLRPRKTNAPRGNTDRLDVVLPRNWPGADGAITYRWAARGGAVQSGRIRDLGGLPKGATNSFTQVWTPAADTLLTRATLPTRSRRKIMQALPYALEEQLLGEPETQHFAYVAENDGSLAVAVTARERVQAWSDALTRSGVRPAALSPAMLLVPWALDNWSLAFHDDEILVRTGHAAGIVCPATAGDPPAMLAAAMREAVAAKHAPEALIVFQPPGGFSAEKWGAALGVPVRIERASPWDKRVESDAPINLLQGQFAPSGERQMALRPYLPAAIMLVLWFAGNTVIDTIGWWRLHRQQRQYTGEMTSILMAAFPDTKVVLDPAAQMQRNMEALQAHQGTDMVPLLAILAPALGDGGAKLHHLRYSDKAVTVDLTLASAAALESIKQRLANAGLRVDVVSTTPRGGELDGRLHVEPAAPAPAPD